MDSTLMSDVVEEPAELDQSSDEQMEFEADAEALAVVGNSQDWPIIQAYLDERIGFYREGLGGIDVSKLTMTELGEKFLVCSLVAMEFEALKTKISVITKAVNERRKPRSST